MCFKSLFGILGLALLPSISIASDARSTGMGKAGVASADYTVASFYNPALLATPDQLHGFGAVIAASYAYRQNKENANKVKGIEQFDDLYSLSPENISSELIELTNNNLSSLDGKAIDMSNMEAAYAFAIPNAVLPISFFIQGESTRVDSVHSADYKTGSVESTKDRIENSTHDKYHFFVANYGVTFAQLLNIRGETISLGISPKYQKMSTRTSQDTSGVDDAEVKNYGSGVNFDLGALWYRGPWRMALSVRDIIGQEVDVDESSHYELNPYATLGGAYTGYNYVLTADIDLNKQEHFSHLDDETQFVRFGAEMGTSGWIQFRVGYEADLEDTVDNLLTMGIGLSPWQVVHLDLAYSYRKESSIGFMMNLKVTL
ncbi:conjugal transfer protein TraF [Vibrio sp. JC009]|uniref:conjugal transfer protein TraF n=1 Tax=Vibrio sp. JC009 TaxID=2912314 RepID=UPI0023B11997|nr:conjugal transfer protein TraF [Vibrio sp. JC009]WED21149.1 conjugal transfer protein TraF [Vibrio sp. JC009]